MKNLKIMHKWNFIVKIFLLFLVIGVIFLSVSPFVNALEDPYEDNNGYVNAYDLNSNAGNWLSDIGGRGYQNDYDWYLVDLSLDRLVVCFTGDIIIQLSRSGDVYNFVYDNSDFERGMMDVEPSGLGIWYIRISGSDEGNSYDLYWDNVGSNTEDNYEENDIYSEEYDLSAYEDAWL